MKDSSSSEDLYWPASVKLRGKNLERKLTIDIITAIALMKPLMIHAKVNI